MCTPQEIRVQIVYDTSALLRNIQAQLPTITRIAQEAVVRAVNRESSTNAKATTNIQTNTPSH